MAQNFVQDGVTLTAPVAAGVTKIYTGTPVYLSAGGVGAAPAGSATGIDGISMNTCSVTRDDDNYIYTNCIYQTEGVWSFKVKTATTFVLGDDVFIEAVDNSTAAVAGEQEGARTTVTNRAGATSSDVAIGKCVALGSLKALGTTVGTDYIQCKLVTRANSNIANK
jgi:hypothetical protein